MTRKERLTRCYENRETDRPAVYTRSGYPADASYDKLKAYMWEHSEQKLVFNSMAYEQGIVEEWREEPYSDDFKKSIGVIHTSKGDLTSEHLAGLKGQPGMTLKHWLSDRGDAEKFLSLPDPVFGAKGNPKKDFDELLKKVGDRGIVDVATGWNNPGGAAAGFFGSENFAVMSVTDRDIIYALCDRLMNITLKRVRFLLSQGIGPFFHLIGQEMIVPPLHGPTDYNDFNLTYDKPIVDLIHNAGGRVHCHCHGPIKVVMQGLMDTGFDVLHPIEPPPMGDVTAKEAKAVLRGKMCMEGNIQIHRMYEASPQEIREETEQLIRDAYDDHKGLIVAPSASPYITGKGEECFEQYRAMVETVENWGN